MNQIISCKQFVLCVNLVYAFFQNNQRFLGMEVDTFIMF